MNSSLKSRLDLELKVIGWVRSSIKSPAQAPKQEYEGAPDVWIDMEPAFKKAMHSLKPGARYLILTWLHQADRTCLQVHPRGNPNNPLMGVFSTRSPARPNPIGLHEVTLLEIRDSPPGLHVDHLETIDGTPVLDIKPCLKCDLPPP